MKPAIAALFLSTVACTGWFGEPEEAHEDHHDEEEGHAEDHPDELEIGPEVLRDLRLTTAPARTASADERATLLGELTVDEGRYAEVGPPVPARVTGLLAEPGDTVAVGQALIELESSDLGRARADLASARARTGVALREAERKRALSGGAVSAREAEEAEAGLLGARADESAALAALLAFGAGTGTEGGGRFSLRTPVAGVVLTRDAHQGEMVQPDETLFRVADVSRLWLVVHAFERDGLRVAEGAPVDVTFAALPNRAFPGAVAKVGREVDPASRTVPVRVDLDNADGALRPGMSATALVPLGSASGVVTVPGIAVQRCDAGWCVFLPRDEGHFEVRPVGRGRDFGTDVEILSGLVADEIVVVDGAFLLRAEAAKQSGGGDAHHH